MCEFCGCGEPGFRSVAVILPSAEEPDTPEADTFSEREEDEEC